MQEDWLQHTLEGRVEQLIQENQDLRQKLAECQPIPSLPVSSAAPAEAFEIARLQNKIRDLETQLKRYRSTWYYVGGRLIFQTLQTFFLRLPAALGFWFLHLTANGLHRFFPPKR